MSRTPLSLDDMKAIELQIMDEIDRVCREHGIHYVLMYGTLIGAHRHGGFVPWDDDIDICMFREDYERFLEVFPQARSSEHFGVANYRTGVGMYPFTKIVDTGTIVYENFVRKDIATGVWVDIFPLDEGDPENKALYRHKDRVNLMYSFIVADPSVGTGITKLAKRIVCPLVRHRDPRIYARRLDEIARAASGHGAGLVTDYLGESNPEFTFPREAFDAVPVSFEGRTYLAPAGYEEILSTIYGDWRTPPAEDNRPIHTFEAYQL